MSKVYLVTGANSGLGLDATRQLALKEDTKVVYMACRSESKAQQAMETLAGVVDDKSKLQFVPFNGSANKADLKEMVSKISLPLDGIIFNAGGYGRSTTATTTEPNQVLESVQINLIGHAHYLDAMENAKLLKNGTRIVFSGTEASRGIGFLGVSAPDLPDSPEELQKYMDGSAYGQKYDVQQVYATTKGIATLYFSSWARAHPDQFVLVVSPGGTKGTAISGQEAIDPISRYIFKIMQTIMGWFGYFHSLEVGAKRYVDAVTGAENFGKFQSGAFVATANGGASGDVGDQTVLFESGKQYASVTKQDAMYKVMEKYR